MNLKHAFIAALSLVFAATAASAQESGVGDFAANLERGGYTIVFRHAKTDWSQTDGSKREAGSCAEQRNLSEEGRTQARAIGAGFTALRIPVGEVLSSAYCRTLETARIGFGVGQTDDRVTSVFQLGEPLRSQRIAGFKALLASAPASGNRVIVTHDQNILAVSTLSVAEGEAAVFQADGVGGFKLIRRITPDSWRR
jgi:phosphohistidine phosphatase SixA